MLPAAPDLEDLARGVVADALGTGRRGLRLETLQRGSDRAVLLVTVAGSPGALVLKLAGPGVDLERTAAVSALASAAGAPVPAVLVVGASSGTDRWGWLLRQHLEGVEWRTVRSVLDPLQVEAAHRQIAEALLAVQSVRFPSFGELDRRGQPAGGGEPDGGGLLAALRHRAELRIADEAKREAFCALLDREAQLFAGAQVPTLCHDDLHHANVVFRQGPDGWALAGLLDWDKAWAGPAESDVARMAFWDDMTGPGFWAAYRAAVPAEEGQRERALVYQLLWCLEYDVATARHAADTAHLCRRLGVRLGGAGT